jgi:AAA family ATP:ADP antiporter
MLSRIATALWGKFESRDELKKFGILGLIFGLIIGTYWALRPMKDSIFNAIVGGENIWLAKIVSLCVIFPLVILYGKLIDWYPRHKVFYFLIGIYAILAVGFTWAFFHPEIGLLNTTKNAGRVIGWAWYVYVESFGSLIVALFWAFTTDITTSESAKRGFPVIALLGQTGNILGPWILNTRFLGVKTSAPLVGISAALMVATGILLWVFMRVVPKNQLEGYHGVNEEKESEPGFLEGLKLLCSHAYLLGIFAIVTIYEIIITIIDFHFKQSAFAEYANEAHVNAYLADYAVWTGIIATLCVFLGINNIQRKLGMTVSLLLLPVLVIGAILMIKMNPMTLPIAFWIMVFSKAVNYALNQPTLKQLYIPTTKDAKYKSQAWIEMFGSRGSKAIASAVNSYRPTFIKALGFVQGVNKFLSIVTVVSLGMIGAWFVVAWYVAKTFNKAIKENKVVC